MCTAIFKLKYSSDVDYYNYNGPWSKRDKYINVYFYKIFALKKQSKAKVIS